MLSAFEAALQEATPDAFLGFSCLLGIGFLTLLGLAFWQLRRARLIEDTPTSKVRSAAQGYVEFYGLARLLPGPAIVSPLTGTRCCWWQYTVEEQQQDDSGRSRGWRVIERATSDELFLLVDETGECIIDPLGASVTPSLSRRWYGKNPRPGPVPKSSVWFGSGQYRYRERLIGFGDSLYAIGSFRTQGVAHEFRESDEVRELLAEWKRNRRELMARFDRDRDGQIDAEEWEQARRAALAEVREAQVERSADPDLHVLSRPTDGRPFLLSTAPQAQLAQRCRVTASGLLLLALLLGGLLLHGLQLRGSIGG